MKTWPSCGTMKNHNVFGLALEKDMFLTRYRMLFNSYNPKETWVSTTLFRLIFFWFIIKTFHYYL